MTRGGGRAQLRWGGPSKFVRAKRGPTLNNRPVMNCAGVAYADPADSTLRTAVAAYGQPGGLLVTSRGAYGDQCFIDAAAAGCTVLLYIDAIVLNTTGRYHSLLYNSSAYGSAVPVWSPYTAVNGTGDLADFRIGGIEQSKLEAILELAVAENPHIGGFFADDLGSMSFFPGMDWATVPTQDKNDYRAGAIAIANTFRTVCDRHGLFLMVNGTWNGGTVASNGGGYPVVGTHGLSLADGFYVEHHDGDDLAGFWTANLTSAQWASASPLTNGTPFHLAVMATSGAVPTWTAANVSTWVTLQPGANYDYPPTPTYFHATGLPTRVMR